MEPMLGNGGKALQLPMQQKKPKQDPAMIAKPRPTTKSEAFDRIMEIEAVQRKLIAHAKQSHQLSGMLAEEARQGLSGVALLLKTMVRKGLLTEDDLKETHEIQRKEIAAREALKSVTVPPQPVVEPPASAAALQ